MTLEGVAGKSLLLLGLVVASGALGWSLIGSGGAASGMMVLGSVLIAFVIAIVTVFKKKWSPVTAPLYALFEGFAVGAISRIYNDTFAGIVLQALLLTLGIFLSMLIIYRTRLIKVTENFKLGIAAATGGIALYYLAYIIGGMFGFQLPLVADNSGWGIGFTVFVIIIAALNLVVDFDFIEKGAEARAPKYMEWYSSFGLLVTIVWLYLEILRLLAKLRSR